MRDLSTLRGRLGIALLAGGGFLVAAVASRYAAGAYRAEQARIAWTAHKAGVDVALSRREAMGALVQRVVMRGAPVAQLLIPRIALDEIVLEGVGDDELNAGPGHLPGTPLPGGAGNSVVSAHRDRHFSRLDEVQLGDTIVTDSGLARQTWRVVARRVVGREAPALFAAREPTLTLTTCWPIRYIGTAPERLIITAHLVAPASTTQPLAHATPSRASARDAGSAG